MGQVDLGPAPLQAVIGELDGRPGEQQRRKVGKRRLGLVGECGVGEVGVAGGKFLDEEVAVFLRGGDGAGTGAGARNIHRQPRLVHKYHIVAGSHGGGV